MTLSVAEIRAHPGFKDVVPYLEPTSKGDAVVATSRDGPLNLSYEIHGHGPIRLVWVMGLNGLKHAWHRQTRYFGHQHGNKYSCLIWDNRGVGHSHRPSVRYSTSGMAHDLYELLEHVGWAGEEDRLNVIGVSMGGMIAMEFATAHPTLLHTLTLLSTCPRLKIFSEPPWRRLPMLIPKPFMVQMSSVQRQIFTSSWLTSADTASYADTHFPTNADRFVAEELHKLDTAPAASRLGFLLQMAASAFHHVKAERLRALRAEMKGKRVLVVHGTEDRMITVDHGDDIVAGLGGVGEREGEAEVVYWKVRGQAHCVMVEMPEEFNGVIERFVGGGELGELPLNCA